MSDNNFPDSNSGLSDSDKNSIINIGGIKIPNGNTLAIWFLVITVMAIAFLGYGFWNIMDRVLDSKLGDNDKKNNTEIVQKDYNVLFKKSESLEAANKMLIDSLNKFQIEKAKSKNDSVMYFKTEPIIKKHKR